MAYLVGRYPAVSHTFIQREVVGLRRLGVHVDTFSVHEAPPSEVLSARDREEFARTYAVVPARPLRHLAAHLAALRRSPGRYLGTLRHAVGQPAPARRREAGDESLHLLMVGRMVKVKGLRLLVGAVAELAARGIDATATVVGDGPDREGIEQLAPGVGGLGPHAVPRVCRPG